MKHYFITGGTGFLGRAIVRALIQAPDVGSITLLTRNAQRRYEMLSWDSRIKLYEGDITTAQLPYGIPFTHLIHGANEANDLLQPDQHAYYYTIVEGTNRVLDWAASIPTLHHRLIISSGAVSRDTTYGRAKRQAERLARCGANCIARVYSLIGEETPLNGQYALGQFLAQAIYEKEVRLWGGAAQRTYIHVEDAARWLLTILDCGTPLVPYDVAGEDPVSMGELATMIANTFIVPIRVVREDGKPRGPDLYLPQLRSSHSLGLKQTIGLHTALERLKLHYA